MRLTRSLLLAALSVCLLGAPALGQQRPRYGGTLRIELREHPASIETTSLSGHIFETLVRFDNKGDPQPHLAVSWTHDPARRRWTFKPRDNVRLHDGTLWTPAASSVSFPDDKPIDEILRDLARPQAAIIVRTPEGQLLGTGPFRIAGWEPGKRLSLVAHDDYWGGRPFLDGVEVQFARSYRDQAVDMELNRADVIEAPAPDIRRLNGPRLSVTAPSILLAIVFDDNGPSRESAARALALSLDRASIHSVLLQKQGEPTGALLPQWLSGLAFLFPTTRDLNAARRLAAGTQPLAFEYDRDDPLLRAIAERVMLNASEAGLRLRAAAASPSDLRLAAIPIRVTDPRAALRDLAAALRLQFPATDDLYEAEKALLESARVIPLFHLPVAHQLSPAVRGWRSSEPWPLADVGLDNTGGKP